MDEKIEKLKRWCKKNYNRGGDVMVECWDDADFEALLHTHGGNYNKALGFMRDVVSIFRDKQDDARNSKF